MNNKKPSMPPLPGKKQFFYLDKDRQTNLAGFIGAGALVAQWGASKFGIDLGITADVLDAVTVICGTFVAWKVGKK